MLHVLANVIAGLAVIVITAAAVIVISGHFLAPRRL
jgi:hypothetical protein